MMKKSMKRKPKTLYEKQGKKFVPVGLDDIITAHVEGDYLVRVRKNSRKMTGRTIALNVDWAKAEIMLDEMADAIVDGISEANKLEAQVRPNTPIEQKAWDAYCKVLKTEHLTMTKKSAYDIAQNAVKRMRENLRGKSECPKGCLEVYAER